MANAGGVWLCGEFQELAIRAPNSCAVATGPFGTLALVTWPLLILTLTAASLLFGRQLQTGICTVQAFANSDGFDRRHQRIRCEEDVFVGS